VDERCAGSIIRRVGRIKHHTAVRRLLDTDRHLRGYFEQETTELPKFYVDLARKDPGALWERRPEGAMNHDPNAISNP